MNKIELIGKAVIKAVKGGFQISVPESVKNKEGKYDTVWSHAYVKEDSAVGKFVAKYGDKLDVIRLEGNFREVTKDGKTTIYHNFYKLDTISWKKSDGAATADAPATAADEPTVEGSDEAMPWM